MSFRTLFREVCGFVCSKFAGSEFVDFAVQTTNKTLCSPTASAVVLYASNTLPIPDGIPFFAASSLITMFWCVLLSLVYLMSFPNRLSTTLTAALQKSRAVALEKELSVVKTASENLSLKHQLALDDLNARLKQTVEAHDLDVQNALRDATKKHKESTKTLVDEHRREIAAVKEACMKEISDMAARYDRDRQTFEFKHSGKITDLRLQMMKDATRTKQETTALRRTIKEQENLLEQADEDIKELAEEHVRAQKDAAQLRKDVRAQEKRSITMRAEKNSTISELEQKLQRTARKLNDALTDVASQEFVDEKDWYKLKVKVSKLEAEAGTAWRELRGSEEHVRILNSQLHDFRDLYHAAKSEAGRQTNLAHTHAIRATLKLTRMRKTFAKRSQRTRSSPKVEGQATIPKAANKEEHSNRATINTQVTAQTITNPRKAQSPEVMQLKQTTSKLKIVEAELATCKESAKTAHKVAAQNLKAAKDSLVLSESKLQTLRERLDQEQVETLRLQTELSEVMQVLSHCEQHSGQVQAQLEAVRRSLNQERSSGLHAQNRINGLERELEHCKQHGVLLTAQLEESNKATNAAVTKVSELTLALNIVNQQLQCKQNEELAVEKQKAEYAKETSDSNHGPEEPMELEHQTEEAPMEWEDVLDPNTTSTGVVADELGESTAPMDTDIAYSEPDRTQGEDVFMDDESLEETARLIEEALSADPVDMDMTAAPSRDVQVSAPPREAGLPVQIDPPAPQHTSDVDPRLFDPALFGDAPTALTQPNTDAPALLQTSESPGVVHFEMQQQPAEPANYPEPPETPALFHFDPALMSLNEFNATPRSQGVTSSPYFSPPPAASTTPLEDSFPTDGSRVQATAPPPNAPPLSTAVESSVDIMPNALATSSSSPSISFASDPPLSAVQQGKKREDPQAKVTSETASAPSAEPRAVEEEGRPKKRAAGQSWREGIDPKHEIFDGGYTSSDFDDDGSTISSVHASDFAGWESDEYNPGATKDDDAQSGKSEKIEFEPGDFDNCYSDIESDHGTSEEHNGKGSNTRSGDADKEFGKFVQDLKTQLTDEEVNAKVEAARLKKIDNELQARARRAGPGPSSRDTAPAERRVIAPKSKKNKRR
ncbi:hypothetical protein MMC18_000484 [Xylographa bjoerkii]|nr:hypothetical protein [Xylographa bjoerkii]